MKHGFTELFNRWFDSFHQRRMNLDFGAHQTISAFFAVRVISARVSEQVLKPAQPNTSWY